MLQNATPLRKFPPWSPNTSNSCVSSAAPAMGHASVQILFKCPTPAIIFETATKPSRCVHFWQGAQSLVQKCSVPLVFLTFWLGNVLRATAACTFSTSQLPKVLRTWGVLAFSLANVLRATTECNFSSLVWPDCSAPAALASLLFDPLEPQIIGKTQCFATFLPFRAPKSYFFWLSLLWSSFFFYSLLWLFPSLLFICPYCRKFDF